MDLSIVIPVYNEEESLPHLHAQISAALIDQPFSWQVIYVDDCSRDESLAILEHLAAADPDHVVVVAFARNFGQTAAMSAGVDAACGDVVVFMDADLQNDPIDIPAVLAKLQEGYDVVSGWRKARQDSAITRKLPSRIANGLISRVTGVRLHDYGCSLKAYRREFLTRFRLYGEMHRFIPVYAQAAGARVTEMVVNHHARRFGQSKYGLGRTMKVILDLCTVRVLTAFATKPAYFFGRPGINAMLLGLLAVVGAPIAGFVYHQPVAGWALVLAAILLGGTGLLCILLGVLAEMVMRTYYESRRQAPYLVKRRINACKDDEIPLSL